MPERKGNTRQNGKIMTKTDRITTSVVCAQLLLNQLSEIKTEPYCQKELKKYVNLVIPHLVKSEQKHYDKFFDAHEKSTDEVYAVFSIFVSEIANVPVYDMENLLSMYRAYKLDKSKIEKAVNEILIEVK